LPSGSSYLISSELLQRYGCKRDILVWTSFILTLSSSLDVSP
jgi:hypothetical protein